MSGEDVQGIRTGPLVASLILLFLSCILTLVSLNSDWASMSVEMEYTSDERDAAYNFGYELPELSMDVFFGLTDMTMSVSNDGLELEETTKLVDLASESGNSDTLGMDWEEWYSTGKATSIALWFGFIAIILGSVSVLIGVSKTNDTAHGVAIILCGIAASLINVGWLNWFFFGGGLPDFVDTSGNGFTSDGFGVSTGFLLCLVSGLLLIIVPFILAWSQELPIDKLLPLRDGFAELEMRHYQPSVRLNTSIVLTLACLLAFSGLSQGIASAYFYSEIPQSSSQYADETDTDQQVLIPWISIRELVLQDWNEPIDGTLNDGDSMSYSFFEEGTGDVNSWQEFEIDVVCDDGGDGETGAPNAQEETDTLHWTIRAKNGQELAGSFDCDGDNNKLFMANEGNEDFENWFVGLGPQGLIFHDVVDADSYLESAPLIDDMFPISVEFTAETRGHTLDQNQDMELEFNSEPIRYEDHVSRCSRSLYYYTFMATEDYYPHRHYNSSS
jgi:hypothetical protein